MTIMYPRSFLYFLTLTLHVRISITEGPAASHSEVRLSNGWHGRVEVAFDGQRGSVCDDQWDDNDCRVICRQIGYRGGSVVADASKLYGEGSGPILLDDVQCSGTENSIDECKHEFWGVSNCIHKEDAGCACDQPTAVAASASCDRSLHRLVEFDPVNSPGVGRVELRQEPHSSTWYGICDDRWNDAGAKVFCKCLGYDYRSPSNASAARAFWSKAGSKLPPVPILYDRVSCDEHVNCGNLRDCDTRPASGKCKPEEAAMVACKGLPHSRAPGAPRVTADCDNKRTLTVCFTSSEYALNKEFLATKPGCVKAVTRDVIQGVCLDIDMEVCPPANTTIGHSTKSYCYDISYTQYDSNPDTLLLDQVWTRRACCDTSKNGTVSTNFQPRAVNHDVISATSPTNFSLECYNDETFSGAPLDRTSHLRRGQDIFCKVVVHTWDPNMYLVVPSCKFLANQYGSPSFDFHNEKCPTTTSIQINYFNFGSHKWGFKFPLPKFQGYPSLFLSCDAYVCDGHFDHKPYCDRSCDTRKQGWRKRRSVQNNIPRQGVTKGPFTIEDSGFGPMILDSGKVIYVPEPQGRRRSRGSGTSTRTSTGNSGTSSSTASVTQASQLVALASVFILVSYIHNY